MKTINNLSEIIFNVIVVLIVAAFLGVLLAYPVMLIWNYLMPEVFGMKVITFWQAFWMTALIKMLLIQESSTNDSK